LSLAFLLLFLRFQSEAEERPILLSLCLAFSLESSFFVGGILLLSWGIYLAVRETVGLIRRRRTLGNTLILFGMHLVFPLIITALCLALEMVSFGGSRIFFKPLGPGQAALLVGLNFGLLTIGGIGGLAAARYPGKAFQAVLLAVSLSLILFIRIASFESDISLKAGLVVILVLTLLTFRTAENPKTAPFFLPLTLLIAIPGLMTAVLDIRNSADIRNSRFTSSVSFEEMRMLEWLRDNVPADRTVQNFPPARSWNLSAIPAFSGRQMFVGDQMHGQIFQVPPDLYEGRIEDLRRALRLLPSSPDGVRKLGIDYLFWGEDERRYFGFEPDLPPVRRIGKTVVYTLAPR